MGDANNFATSCVKSRITVPADSADCETIEPDDLPVRGIIESLSWSDDVTNEAHRTARRRGPQTWTLTPESFEKLLEFLDPDRDIAGLKYEDLRRKLVRYLEVNRCLTPLEQVDMIMNLVARKLQEGLEYRGEPAKYFFGVARNVMKAYWRRSKQVSSLDPLSAVRLGRQEPVGTLDGNKAYLRFEAEMETLDQCLEALTDDTRLLMIAYYRSTGAERRAERERLALRFGVSPNTLRLRAFRAKQKLRDQFLERMRKRDRISGD